MANDLEYRTLRTPLGHECQVREVPAGHGRRWHVKVKGRSFYLYAGRRLSLATDEEHVWRAVLSGVDEELVSDRSHMAADYESPLSPQNFEETEVVYDGSGIVWNLGPPPATAGAIEKAFDVANRALGSPGWQLRFGYHDDKVTEVRVTSLRGGAPGLTTEHAERTVVDVLRSAGLKA
jgi:hypothetical protein